MIVGKVTKLLDLVKSTITSHDPVILISPADYRICMGLACFYQWMLQGRSPP